MVTSPAANIAGFDVLLASSVITSFLSVSFTRCLTIAVSTSYPISTNTPSTFMSFVFWVLRFFIVSVSTNLFPFISVGTLLRSNSIFLLCFIFSTVISSALNSSLRWIKYALFATLASSSAASTAAFPPPMTAVVFLTNNGASQVAHVLTPLPKNFCSPGMLRLLWTFPNASIYALLSYFFCPAVTSNPVFVASTFVTRARIISVPKWTACSSNFFMSSGPGQASTPG